MLERKQQQSDARRLVHEASLTAWLEQDGDHGLGARMRVVFKEWLANFAGSNRLSLGLSTGLLEHETQDHEHICTADCELFAGADAVVAKSTELPFSTASMDLVILNFGLDLAPQPVRVLQEVSRVLVPGGRLLIAGVNMFSSKYAAAHILPSLKWMRALKPISCHKLLWLLRQADLCPDDARSLCQRTPVASPSLKQKLLLWQEAHRLGELYVVNARKEKLEPVFPERMLYLQRWAESPVPLHGS